MKRRNANKPTIIDYLNQLDKINRELANIDRIAAEKAKQIFPDGWKDEIRKQLEDAVSAINF